MKLYEAMKLLDENRTDVYEAKMNDVWKYRLTAKTGFGGYYHFEVFEDNKLVDQSFGSGGFNGNVAFNLDWQLVRQPVRQPVTWQEAIQAWADGKKVSYSYKGYDKRYGFEHPNAMLLTTEKIKHAEWYVEDEG